MHVDTTHIFAIKSFSTLSIDEETNEACDDADRDGHDDEDDPGCTRCTRVWLQTKLRYCMALYQVTLTQAGSNIHVGCGEPNFANSVICIRYFDNR